MVARIYKPAKTSMQSGMAATRRWVLEFEPDTPRVVEPLMGWTSSADMRQQIRMSFESQEAAIAYAERHGIAYEVVISHPRRSRPKAYADNFRFDRPVPWTH